MTSDFRPCPVAVIAAPTEEIADYLRVHLEDRGFAVEVAHRVEYLLGILDHCDLVLCRAELLAQVVADGERRPEELIVLSRSPSAAEEDGCRSQGACEYFAVPFRDTERLASVLDSAAARIAAAQAAAIAPRGELAGASG